jgi:CO/xanthine dehydrogenase Mo-binding subunit
MRTGSVLPTGQVLTGSVPVAGLLEACARAPMPPEEPTAGRDLLRYPGGTGNVTHGEGLRRGVGYAAGFKNIAFSEGFDDSAAARVTVSMAADGPVAEIHTAAVEMGQGLTTVLTQIARTELGIEQVVLHAADTGVGSAGSTSASRQSVMAGGAVQKACERVRERLFALARDHAASDGAGAPAGLALDGGWVTAAGTPVASLASLLAEPVSETAVYHHRPTTGLDPDGQGDTHVAFTFAAQRAVVEVDTELGLVRVVDVVSAIDAGKVMNPLGFEGQIEGGTAQGLGFALMEEIQVDHGIVRNPSFTDYLIPTISDVPPMVTVAVEDPEPGLPYGLKGIGEAPSVTSTAAIVAALRDATGRELNRAPVTPDDLTGLRAPRHSDRRPPIPDVPGQEPVLYYQGQASAQGQLM